MPLPKLTPRTEIVGGDFPAEGLRTPLVFSVAPVPGRKRLRPPVDAQVDWVIAEEIPQSGGRPSGSFLQFATRRAFFEDHVQVRVQVRGLALSSSTRVQIFVRDHDPLLSDDLSAITNDSALKPEDHPAGLSKRPLKPSNDIEVESFSESVQNILVQVDAATKTSFLATTINLPLDPSGSEVDDLELFAVIRIEDQGQVVLLASPQLTACRWFARPDFNLGIRKTAASSIVPLIDGDHYFGSVLAAMNAATSRICIASWTLDLDTPMGPGGPPFRQAALNAANRGVDVLLLLDFINGRFNVANIKNLGHPKVRARLATHPFTLPKVGQFGTYHEKYVIVDGKVAFPGGIDISPDRVAPIGHATKLDARFFLWHDAGVRLEGHPAQQMDRDFTRRWNEAHDFVPKGPVPGGDLAPSDPAQHLSMPPVLQPPPTGHNLQIVKTDTIVTQPGPFAPNPSPVTLKQLGTRNVFEAAFRGARHFIYIENQYFRDPKLGDALVDALTANPKLQLIVVVPFFTEEQMNIGGAKVFPEQYVWALIQESGAAQGEAQERAYMHGDKLQFELIQRMRAVPDAGKRVGIYTLARCLGGTPEIIYPHSKTAVVDDTWAYIGSANTNGRSFGGTDAEIGAVIHDRATVTAYRRALWKEHLGRDIPSGDVRTFQEAWKSSSIKGKKKVGDCNCGELGTVHVVDFIEPPKGQQYNGPLEFLFDDDFV